MKTQDFMNEVTVEGLNKQLRKDHGVTVDIAKYSKAQLEGYAKKLDTKLKEFEVTNSYNESLTNESYQRNSLIKKLVETAINQYIDNPLESVDEEDLGEDIVEVDSTDEDVARDFAIDEGTENSFDESGCVGEMKKLMASGCTKEDMYKKVNAEYDCGREKFEKLYASNCNESVNETVIKEGEEDKAALVMASKDMVDRFTSFLEDVAEMNAEGLLQIQDQIRDELGNEQAEQFANTVSPALDATIENLKTSREALTNAIGILTGEGAPEDTIGAEPDMEEPMDSEEGPMEPIDPEGDDEFAASDPATGGTEPEGREKRESYVPKKKSIAESNSVFTKLAGK